MYTVNFFVHSVEVSRQSLVAPTVRLLSSCVVAFFDAFFSSNFHPAPKTAAEPAKQLHCSSLEDPSSTGNSVVATISIECSCVACNGAGSTRITHTENCRTQRGHPKETLFCERENHDRRADPAQIHPCKRPGCSCFRKHLPPWGSG